MQNDITRDVKEGCRTNGHNLISPVSEVDTSQQGRAIVVLKGYMCTKCGHVEKF
jgi:hypothetical protein